MWPGERTRWRAVKIQGAFISALVLILGRKISLKQFKDQAVLCSRREGKFAQYRHSQLLESNQRLDLAILKPWHVKHTQSWDSHLLSKHILPQLPNLRFLPGLLHGQVLARSHFPFLPWRTKDIYDLCKEDFTAKGPTTSLLMWPNSWVGLPLLHLCMDPSTNSRMPTGPLDDSNRQNGITITRSDSSRMLDPVPAPLQDLSNPSRFGYRAQITSADQRSWPVGFGGGLSLFPTTALMYHIPANIIWTEKALFFLFVFTLSLKKE